MPDHLPFPGTTDASYKPSALSGVGELADLVRAFDWSGTPLGRVAEWPQSLRTVVNILLTSRYAMWMGWGKDLTFLYNDAYRPTLGIKHPAALGSAASQVWAEIWGEIGPRIEQVLVTGCATYDEALFLVLERSGFPEETYHTFSYSPLSDESGTVNGMLCVVTEETERIISERRMGTLRDLATGLAAASSERGFLAAAQEQLGTNRKDLPFTLLYLFEAGGKARLVCRTGVDDAQPAAPEELSADAVEPWRVKKIFQRPVQYLESEPESFWDAGAEPCGAWPIPSKQTLLVPIKQQGHEAPAGFLVIGLNPYRQYDAAYAGFVELVAGQLAAGLANARAYDQERRRAEGLAELDRAKTTFFSNVSHEFRTPLTLMLGPVEDLLAKGDGGFSEDDRELLAVIQRSVLRLQRLVNSLLDFSRIEAGRVQAQYEPVDLAALTSELASSFRSAMERAGLTFVVECGPLPEPIYVDREMWEKIVLNLLSNALKYTLEGSVEVSLSARNGTAELAVCDTGIGIPEDELPRVFQRFQRIESARGRTHEGSGIGLALVQELARLHGGRAGVTSSAGRGSTFKVSLPFGSGHLPAEQIGERDRGKTANQARAFVEEALRWLPSGEVRSSASAMDEGAVPLGSAQRSRVLLADDNADMRDYVSRLLSARYEVRAARNGREALEMALADPPDLVLTDVMMPELDGFGLLRELRAHEGTKVLPILLLSARAGEESRVEGLDAGADDYLVKPFAARELLARVEAHLSLARMRRQADQARRLSEVRLGLVLESTGMLAWEWRPGVDEIEPLGDLHRVFGTSFTDSTTSLQVVDPEDAPEHRAKVEQVRREGGSYYSEFRIRRPDTEAIAWLAERATGITDEQGRVTSVVGVVADISERKAVEDEIQRKNAELMKANRELEEFAYVASHDLQEPLRMVNIYTQLLLRRGALRETEQSTKYAEFIRKGVMRMEELINDLLVYSRVVHPEQEEPGAADLNAALDEAVDVLRGRINESGANVTRLRLPKVLGDERQLALVFQNLLSNALKYRAMNAPPEIEISAETDGGECVVRVRDNGIGFSPSHAERIFGLFKRLHKDAYPGTGLGLAICKRIIERYGGTIWGESEGEGCGAVFSFRLRRAGMEAASAPASGGNLVGSDARE